MGSPINLEFSRRERELVIIENILNDKSNLENIKVYLNSKTFFKNKRITLNFSLTDNKINEKNKNQSISENNYLICFPNKNKTNFNLKQKNTIKKIGMFKNYKEEYNNFINMNDNMKLEYINKKIRFLKSYQNKRNQILNLNEKINSIEEFINNNIITGNEKLKKNISQNFSNYVFENININEEINILNLVDNYLKLKSKNKNNKILYY